MVLEKCPKCGEAIQRTIKMPLFDGTGATYDKVVNCSCACKRKEEEEFKNRMNSEAEQRRMQELKRASLMDSKLQFARLSTFQKTKENEKLYKIASNYVGNFNKMLERGQGLMFFGDVGTGKSFTAACIANELLDQQKTVIMTSFIKLIEKMMDFDDSNEEFMNRLQEVKLLVIDDLGAERGTDYSLEKVYDIIDSRYRSGRPLILTTNLSLSSMKDCEDIRYTRIYDRIFEMCYPVKVEGMSFRKREAASRYKEMKELLEN